MYREKFLCIDFRSVAEKNKNVVCYETAHDVFDKNGNDDKKDVNIKKGKKRSFDGMIRSIPRIIYFDPNFDPKRRDKYVKLLMIVGTGEAFMMPNSNIIVKINPFFKDSIESA